MKKKHVSTSTRITMLICILLLAVNILCSLIFIFRSRSTVKSLVSNRMLEVSNAVAELVDGDVLKTIDENTTKEDENYKTIYKTLDVINSNIHFKYIYIVKNDGKYEDGRNKFVFIIDHDPIDPGLYGDEVVHTDALESAFNGIPAVDLDAYTDRWGSFYTAFSPVYDSNHEMVGIVGIDFESKEYENDVARQSDGIIIVSFVSLVIGSSIALLFSRQMLKRFRLLNRELSSLSTEVDTLNTEIVQKQSEINLYGKEETEEDVDEQQNASVVDLSQKMEKMTQELHRYIEYVHAQAYIDSMTGVSSKTAYLELVKEIEEKIKAGTADFKVIVFDINGLKVMNDNFGHEYGDMLINNTAKVIRTLYDNKQIFRIGGDEFIVIIENETDKTLEENEFDINKAIEDFNHNLKEGDVKVSCSFGGANYNPRIDENFKQVFKRADEEMYRFKGLYYQKYGDRRKH